MGTGWNNIGFIFGLRYLYWLLLKLDADTCAEMPQVKHYKRLKAERFYNKFLN